MQCTYNVTLRCVHVTIVTVKKQYVLHILRLCVCVCVCVALGIQHAKHMRPVVLSSRPLRLHHIFPHFLVN